MKNFAVQLYSIRDHCEKDFFKTLEAVAKMGYHGVEFAGYYGKSAAEIKAKLDELNLKVAGSHIMYDLLFDQLDDVIAFEKSIGNENIVCPWAHFESETEWATFFERLNVAGQKIKEAGLQLYYHNHAHEFELMNGEPILEALMKATQPEFVKLELDTYWTEFAHVETVEFLKKYENRVELVHLKDMKTTPVESTELGNGILPLPAFMNAAKQAKWFVVEQEAFNKDTLDAVEISIQFLNHLWEVRL